MTGGKEKLVIVIVGIDFTIHSPMASSNFVRNMARGLQENGVKTFLVNYACEYGPFQGKVEDINFYIPLEQVNRNENFIIRSYHKIKRFFNLCKFLSKNLNSSDKNVIISYSGSFSLLFLCKVSQVFFFDLSLHYASEHPLRYFPRNIKRLLLQQVYPWFVYLLNDGLLSVSNGMSKFFSRFQKGSKINYIFPPVTDPKLFLLTKQSPFDFEYIGYCGTISRKKDGLEILLRAFSIVKIKFPDIKLVLIGRSESPTELQAINDLIKQLNVEENVMLPGLISYEELPRYLLNARILALSRPSTLQNETGFPSKLTEYLSTKNPVVVTGVGDIPLYIKNGVHGFIAEPGNVDDFAEKLILALNDKKLSQEVGNNGYELVKTIFNYNYQASELIKILKNYSKQ